MATDNLQLHVLNTASSKYGTFMLLPFNRKVNTTHVNRLGKSIEKWGNKQPILCTDTALLNTTGKVETYIIDGQHRHTYLVAKKKPILYCKIEIKSIEELVQLIADLNTTSKRWSTSDFLNAFCMVKNPHYVTMRRMRAEMKLPLAIIAMAVTNEAPKTAMNLFRAGMIAMDEDGEKRATELLSRLSELVAVLPKSKPILYGYLRLLRTSTAISHRDVMGAARQAVEEKTLPHFHREEDFLAFCNQASGNL